MVQMASSNTLIQSMVPDRLRGRIIAVYSMMFMGMAPFGSLSAGAVAHHIGAPWTVALGGVACIAGSVLFLMHLPSVRDEARELILGAGHDRRVSGGRNDHADCFVELATACWRLVNRAAAGHA